MICAQKILSDPQYAATLSRSDLYRILHVVLEVLRVVANADRSWCEALAICVVAREPSTTDTAVAERFKDTIVARSARAIVSVDYVRACAWGAHACRRRVLSHSGL